MAQLKAIGTECPTIFLRRMNRRERENESERERGERERGERARERERERGERKGRERNVGWSWTHRLESKYYTLETDISKSDSMQLFVF
jgi:hypothetical protein